MREPIIRVQLIRKRIGLINEIVKDSGDGMVIVKKLTQGAKWRHKNREVGQLSGGGWVRMSPVLTRIVQIRLRVADNRNVATP